MNVRNDFVHPEHVEHRTAIDELEPLEEEHDELRAAAIKYIGIINAFSERIERALSEPGATLQRVAVAYFGVALALGLNSVAGRSFTEIAETLNCERATLSKAAISFCGANGLEPSFAMKRSGAAISYTEARLRSIAEHNGDLPPHEKAKPFKPMPELPP